MFKHNAKLMVMLALFLLAATNTALAQLQYGTSASSDLYNSMQLWPNNNWLSSSYLNPQDWRLGVQVDNMDTGVYVRQVAPNSAAARANLEQGDVIVAVAGQQVGIVDGRPVDMGMEIKRRADSSGNVTLLVQDGRSGRLAAVRVRLDGSQSSLRGFVVRRDRSYLPNDALVTVSIENLSRPFYVVRNGESSAYVTQQSDIPFEINYDPQYIDPNDAYQIRARITSAGRVIYDTVQPVRVFGSYPTSNVQIEVSPIQPVSVASGGYPPVISAGYGGGNNAYLPQFAQLYRKYLGRNPTDLETAAFVVSANPVAELEMLPINLLAGQQYYDAVGNNNAAWVTSVFQQIIGRQPTFDEREQWLRRFSDLRGSRVELLRQLVQMKR